jgi:hypothetical protein
LLSSKETEQKYYVEKFLNKKVENRKTYYLVKWKDYATKEATWEEKTELIKDIGQQHFTKLVELMKK